MKRRNFLSLLAATTALTALPQIAYAQIPTDKRLIVVVLRGGMDGLAAIPPYADPNYLSMREDLAIPSPNHENGALDLNGFFGLHPALSDLHPLYQQGDLTLFHAIATPYRERSHFDGQNILETGVTTPNSANDGWLNRMLSLYNTEKPLGLAVGNTIPMILYGNTQVTSWSPKSEEISEDIIEMVARIYANDPLFQNALGEALETQQMAEDIGIESMSNNRGGRNNQGATNAAMDAVAGFLNADDGPRVAVISINGWDTHSNQGNINGGLARNLTNLGAGLSHLQQKMQPNWDKTAILVLTEFGRTVAMNGTKGTDHGTAGIAMLMGGAINGGRIITDWPGLSRTNLYQSRDLAPVIDIRSLLKATLHDHMEIPLADIERHIFPNSTNARPINGLFS